MHAHPYSHTSHEHDLFAGRHLIVNLLIVLTGNLWLEVDVNQLAFLRRPFAIGVTVEDQLVGPGVSNLRSSVCQNAIGAPFDLVAGRLRHEERLTATLIAVVIDAFLDRVVETTALGHG